MTDPLAALPLIDCSYGKPRTYELPGRCLTCSQRFNVRRCKGDKPPLSVDCPNCECTEYSWRDLNAILAQPAAPAEGPLTPEEAEGWRTYAKRQGERGKPVVVNPVEFLGLLDRMTAPSEGLHHHDVNGVALWFDGTGGKPVGGPADD